MEAQAYQKMAQEQEDHWWFKARREIIEQALFSLNLPSGCQILETGCGPGGNLEMLGKFGKVTAVEMDDFARNFAKKHSPDTSIVKGWLPDNMPFPDKTFDLICLFDVLEHIENDQEALNKLKFLLKKEGKIILSVPAFQWMYGSHDKMHHHFRRYNVKELTNIAQSAGLRVIHMNFFNVYLFPLVLLSRLVDKIIPKTKSLSARQPSLLSNRFFYWLFRKEKSKIMTKKFPFGASLIAILEIDTKAQSN